MDRSEPVWLPVAYRAAYRIKGSRGEKTGVFHRMVPLHLGRVESDAAPVAFELKLSPGNELDRVAWRLVDGVLMREVMTPAERFDGRLGSAVILGDFKDGRLAALTGQLPTWGFGAGWRDYPFTAPGRGEDSVRGADAAAFERIPDFARWISDDWEARLASATAEAARLVVCGEALLRPAKPPVLSARHEYVGVPTLTVLPGVHEVDARQDRVDFDFRDEAAAVAFASSTKDALRAFCDANEFGVPGEPRVDLTSLVVHPAGEDLERAEDDHDLAKPGLRNLVASMDEILGKFTVRFVDPTLLARYAAVKSACPDEASPGVVAAGVEAALEIASATSRGESWASALEDSYRSVDLAADAVRRREEALTGLRFERDAAAFAAVP